MIFFIKLSMITSIIFSKIPEKILLPRYISYDKEFYTPIYQRYYDKNNVVYISKLPVQLLPIYNDFINNDFNKIMQEKYGAEYNGTTEEKITFLSILLALNYTESRFNPYAKTSSGNSVGLGQLYFPTAEWLLKVNKDKFSQYFSIEGNKITFLALPYTYTTKPYRLQNTINDITAGIIKAQILTTAEILINYKGYDNNSPFSGVRKYNGGGQRARNYAIIVLKRSLLYHLWIMESYGKVVPKDPKNYTELIKELIEQGKKIYSLSIQSITQNTSQEEVQLILNDVKNSLSYEKTKNNDTRKFTRTLPMALNEKTLNLSLSHNIQLRDFTAISSEKCNTYIRIFFRRRSPFSYFYNIPDMIEAFSLPENSSQNLYVYYLDHSIRRKVQDIYDIPKFTNKLLYINIPETAVKQLNSDNFSQYFTLLVPAGVLIRIEDNNKEIIISCN